MKGKMSKANRKKGLVIVNTGDGKGKTTAALGMLLRAWGRGMSVGMLQFLKSGTADYGEYHAARKIGIEILPLGDGCTWNSKDMEATIALALSAWQEAQKRIVSNEYNLLVLDEFTFPLHFGWLETAQVIDWLKANKPEDLHLVITGRHAPAALIEYADLVTEMVVVKHPYETGVPAQAGIEF